MSKIGTVMVKQIKELPKDPEKRQKWLESLSPQELAVLRDYISERLARARRVRVDGKVISLKSLGDEVRRLQDSLGILGTNVRQIPRWKARKLVPSRYLRPNSFKQVLRPEEEEKLELQRMASGYFAIKGRKIFNWQLPDDRKCAFGLYARPNNIQKVLGPAWSNRDPQLVLNHPRFYNDIVQNCHQYEMTLMLLTSRPLKLENVRCIVEDKVRDSMLHLSNGSLLPDDTAALHKFIHLLDDKRVEGADWIHKGKIKQGTHIILNATPKGELAAEAISPGTLASRKTTFIGRVRGSKLLTHAVFDAVIGEAPVDTSVKAQAGKSFLWAANGLPFKPKVSSKGLVAAVTDDGQVRLPREYKVEQLSNSSSLFTLAADNAQTKMLLNRLALE